MTAKRLYPTSSECQGDYVSLLKHTIRVSNGLGTDQERHLVGPELDSNSLRRRQQARLVVVL